MDFDRPCRTRAERHRLLVALLALAGLTAFAPAPFPRSRRGEQAVDLNNLQGTWKIVSRLQYRSGRKQPQLEIKSSGTHIRVAGKNWISLEGPKALVTWQITLDPTKKPCAIDWHFGQPQSPSWVGLIRRKGGQVEVLYHSAPQRPTNFDTLPEGTYILVLQRDGQR